MLDFIASQHLRSLRSFIYFLLRTPACFSNLYETVKRLLELIFGVTFLFNRFNERYVSQYPASVLRRIVAKYTEEDARILLSTGERG